MKKRMVLVLAVIALLVLLAATAVYAVPNIWYVPEGQSGVMYCEAGIPDPHVAADGQSVSLACHSPVAVEGARKGK